MRRMTQDEIRLALNKGNWATICTVDKNNCPYAIEATYFLIETDYIGFMINPRGTTLKNIHADPMHTNPSVLLKITFTNHNLSHWLGISCFGTGNVITDQKQMKQGWELLGKVMDTDYSGAAKKFCKPDTPSPFFRVKIKEMTGQCSYGKDEEINYNVFNL